MTPAHAKRDAVLTALQTRPLLMGIVNVTPDSFSDGGKFVTADAAIAEMHRQIAGGAAIIDVGAESTRPGHTPVPESEERSRLVPIMERMIGAVQVAVSIDTTKSAIATMALEAGAAFINDQWGFQGDPGMAAVAATHGAGVCLMHNRIGIDESCDILDDMRRFFDRSLSIAAAAGVPERYIVLDPGIGFGKSKAQNLQALGAGVAALRTYGRPVLVGASRKSLFATLIGAKAVEDRLTGTLAAHLTARAQGASLFRVHDCAAHRDAFSVQGAIVQAATDTMSGDHE